MKWNGFLLLLLLVLFGLGQTLHGQDFSKIDMTYSFGFGDLGGGVSFVDFNQDGWDDLTFCSAAGSTLRFFKNNSGTFTEVFFTNSSNNPYVNTQETKEATWIDFDNDGDKDLFITAKDGNLQLLENVGINVITGHPNLENISAAAGIPGGSYPAFGSTWGDYNLDGHLDVYIAMYYAESSNPNMLLRNNGNGTFTNVTADANCGNNGTPSFDACFVDINNDLYPDIYIANDKVGAPNALYKNNGDGTFTDISVSSGTNCSIDAMNAGGADYNNDGFFDLYVSNSEYAGAGKNIFYPNNGNETFSEVSSGPLGLARDFTWASTFFDYDNDMDKDLYISCSSTDPAKPSAMLVNGGGGAYSEPHKNTGGLGGADYERSYSHAIGDYDNDGMLDIGVLQMTDNNFFWKNNETNSNKWIKIKLLGTTSNAEGIGAYIEVHTGSVVQYHYTTSSMGYLGQNSDKHHFGLGSNASIDKIRVRWPSGIIDELNFPNQIDQVITIVEGSNATQPLPLELLSFRVETQQDKGVRLHWATASEVNTDHFEIQRSTDGVRFSPIGQVSASGYSNEIVNYSFDDIPPANKTQLYYRLKMVDRDLSFSYSPVRNVRLQAGQPFYLGKNIPNPVQTDWIRLELIGGEDGVNVDIHLLDITGRPLLKIDETLREGTNTIELDLRNVPAGSYVLSLINKENIETIPLIVSY